MAEVVEMPKLSDTMTEGVIAAWHVKEGDKIEAGEILAEVETDKATMEMESYFDGTVLHLGLKEGDAVPIGALMAIIGEKGEDVSDLIAQYKNKAADSSQEAAEDAQAETTQAETAQKETPQTQAAQSQASEQQGEAGQQASPAPSSRSTPSDSSGQGGAQASTQGRVAQVPEAGTNGDGRLKASPLARKLASELGISLSGLKGSGDGGRIVKLDVEQAAQQQPAAGQQQPGPAIAATPPAPAPTGAGEGYEDVRVSQMRKTIARRLAESKYTAPHFYLTLSINMDKAFRFRKELNAESEVKISFNDLVIKAAAIALRQHPQVNAAWQEDHIRRFQHVHVGMAVAVDEGLVVPVIRHADNKGLAAISTEARDFAARARDKKLTPEEMQGNTFSISNLGMFGIEEFTAIINPPDSCILAVGAIQDTPVVKDGELTAAKMMKVTLSCDHRTVDGATGSRFLQTVQYLLENPVRLLL